MDEPVAAYRQTAEQVTRSDRITRATQTATAVFAAACVLVGTVVIGQRQVEYHNEQVSTDKLIQCEISTLDGILAYLAAAGQAQARHQPAPVYHFPKPC